MRAAPGAAVALTLAPNPEAPLTHTSVRTVAVAFSGGPDSLALLHATCRSASALGLQVLALHIHHNLLPEADAWLQHAKRLCARWRRQGQPLHLRWARLEGRPSPGESTEAWARQGRYEALKRLAREEGASLLLLAHHRRDQAETVLLQALRGGGPAGLSAMPQRIQREGLCWARPWLDQPREAIEAYLLRHRLRPVHDPSNQDMALARNRLRLQVWPTLQAAFEHAEVALAGTARRAQEAAAALAELAALDLAPLVDAQGRLQVAGWRALSPARQANALRAWWRQRAGQGAPEALIGRLLAEVPAQGAARWPAGVTGDCELYRGYLTWHARQGSLGHALVHRAAAPAPEGQRPGTWDLSHPGLWGLPDWPGAVLVEAWPTRGAPAQALRALRPAVRAGGERFQAAAQSPPRSLKKQYQSAAVPASGRAGPLLWAGDRLVFVPGLGIDAACWAPAGAPQWGLRWLPTGSSPSGQHKPGG